jgi:general secretion pathway protein G
MPGNRAFTLVELLIVVMIIAILAGMLLLAAGSSLETAEATKVINDLRDVKTAAVLYHADIGGWPAGDPMDAATLASLDKYISGGVVSAAGVRYSGIHTKDDPSRNRIYIGLGLLNKSAEPGVRRKLSLKAAEIGIFNDDCLTPYDGNQTTVYMNLK